MIVAGAMIIAAVALIVGVEAARRAANGPRAGRSAGTRPLISAA